MLDLLENSRDRGIFAAQFSHVGPPRPRLVELQVDRLCACERTGPATMTELIWSGAGRQPKFNIHTGIHCSPQAFRVCFRPLLCINHTTPRLVRSFVNRGIGLIVLHAAQRMKDLGLCDVHLAISQRLNFQLSAHPFLLSLVTIVHLGEFIYCYIKSH